MCSVSGAHWQDRGRLHLLNIYQCQQSARIGDYVDVTLSRHAESDFGQDDHLNVIWCMTEGSPTKELAAVNNQTSPYCKIPASTVAIARVRRPMICVNPAFVCCIARGCGVDQQNGQGPVVL